MTSMKLNRRWRTFSLGSASGLWPHSNFRTYSTQITAPLRLMNMALKSIQEIHKCNGHTSPTVLSMFLLLLKVLRACGQVNISVSLAIHSLIRLMLSHLAQQRQVDRCQHQARWPLKSTTGTAHPLIWVWT